MTTNDPRAEVNRLTGPSFGENRDLGEGLKAIAWAIIALADAIKEHGTK